MKNYHIFLNDTRVYELEARSESEALYWFFQFAKGECFYRNYEKLSNPTRENTFAVLEENL